MSLEVLKKECKAANKPELYIKLVAYQAALNMVRNIYRDIHTAAEVTQATIRLEL
jgi:hypothetical protein